MTYMSSPASEIMPVRFSRDGCTDTGVRIDPPKGGWPGSPRGFASALVETRERDLKPRRFTLHITIVTVPDGMRDVAGHVIELDKETAHGQA